MLPHYFFSRKAWSRLSLNFIKWSIPGIFALVIVLIVIAISFLGEDGSLLGIEIQYPKGILSFISIAMIVSGILGFLMIVKFHISETSSLAEIIGFGLACIVIGGYMLKKELKRLH